MRRGREEQRERGGQHVNINHLDFWIKSSQLTRVIDFPDLMFFLHFVKKGVKEEKKYRVKQKHVQRDVTHSFSQALKCFSHLRTDMQALKSSIHASTAERRGRRKKKIKNRGGLKRSGPAGSWMPEAGCQSPSGPSWERQCGLPASRWPHALWPFTAAVTSVRITELLLSVCVLHSGLEACANVYQSK